MISLVCTWSLVFICGVLGESPTHPLPDDGQDSLTTDPSAFSTEFDYLKYASLLDAAHADQNWKSYSSDIYPLFKKAVQELASSERGILIFWDSLNRPEPPRAFYEQVFRAYNHMVDDVLSSSTTEVTNEATQYNLESTEPEASELVSDVLSREERVEEEEAFYQTSISSDEDVIDVYYSTENPEAEVMVLEGSHYTSSVGPEQHGSKDLDVDYLYEDVSTKAEIEIEPVEPDVAALLGSGGEDVVRRSGILVEKHPSIESGSSSLPLRVGSIRGIPCEDFPCYEEIPITSFTCTDKRVPGIYADLETGCQVFHICWHNRRESFLCPIGTTFNQPITACDYWYSSNCSISSLYFESTTEPQTKVTKPSCKKTCDPETKSTPTEQHTTEKPDAHLPGGHPFLDKDWFRASKFVPVKTKVTVYFKPKDSKFSSSKKTASKTVTKQKRDVMPLIEDFLELTKIAEKDVVKPVPKVINPKVTKSKLFEKPAAKLVPCLEIKDYHLKPTPSVEKEPKPLPTLNPRFIVTPVDVKKPFVKVHYEKAEKVVFPKGHVKQVKPISVHKSKLVNPIKDHASEIVLKALEMAGDVFQRDILALTRQALGEDYKSKH